MKLNKIVISGHKLLLLLFVLCHAVSARSENGILYNSVQRLASSYVNQVYQDETGFIWVATNNGLNRYDGYSFLKFGEEDGLGNENVNCVTADNERNVYAGTPNGIFVKVKGRFHAIKDVSTGDDVEAFVSVFYTMPDGTILFGTSGRGLWKILDTDHAVIVENNDLNFIKSMVCGSNGVLWIATEKRGIVSGRLVGTADKPVFKTIKTHLPHSDFFFPVITMGKNNTPFVGLFGGGLYRFDNKRHDFSLVPGTENLTISSIMMHKDGKLFLGTNGLGVKVYDPSTGEIRQGQFSSNQLDINRTKVVSIIEDRNQNIWLCLFQKGVFMQRPLKRTFSCVGTESCVMSVTKQQDGTIWMACDQNGLYKLDSNLHQLKHFLPSPTSFPSTILTMTEDKSGRLWIGSYTQGCGWIDTNTGQYHRASFSYGNAQAVFDIRCDYKGRMWVGTLGDGLKCYDPSTEKVTEYKNETGKLGLVNNYILQMEISTDRKMLFIGTATGLSCLDVTNGKWKKIIGEDALHVGKAIKALRFSPKTGLWIGTYKGLYNINFKENKEIEYPLNIGGTLSNILSIEFEDKGEEAVWVSTSNGLFRLNPKTGKMNSFYSSDGTQGNEYSDGVSFHDCVTGQMLFGGTDGLTAFNPKNIKPQTSKYDIFISSMEVSGKRVKSFDKSGGYTICEKAVSECEQFDFSYEDNSISINFSTPLYSGTEHTTFSYSINGEKWVTIPRCENTLTLSRLSPGDYHFRVKASDNGRESVLREFTITIHNAWYFTPFARFVYVIIIVIVILWYLRNRKQKQRQIRALQEHKLAEEINEQKLQFFINLSHDMRTPMTLIVTPIMKLIREDGDAARQATYEVIRRNAERILSLINQILDIRKIDKGQMNMHMHETPIVPYMDDIIRMFQSHASHKHINYTVNVDVDTDLTVWIDRSHFDKVLMNLLSNAFKYTQTGGTVTVTLTADEKNFTIRVFDDGEKLQEKDIQRIFNRFYQSDNSVNSNKSGAGIGLHIVKSIVELHHGTVEASNVENGVLFTVTIPLGSANLSPEEIETDSDKASPPALASRVDPVSGLKAPREGANANEQLNANANSNSHRPMVIIIEDEDDIRDYLTNELSTTYRVKAFSDGAEALPTILREIPQIIVSDVMMPNMDGYTLCSRVKANVNTNHIPFILLTAKSLDDDKLQGLETGADLYVTKPFNMDLLRHNIANLIASRHLMQNKFTGKEEAGAQLDTPEVESFDEKLLSRIMSVINNNINNSDLNIDMICREVGISRVHLHRKMKELTNQTPHDFIRNLRMKQAARMLSQHTRSVTEIMYLCGFNSATSFSTMFKKMYGVSPREYMKEHGEK